MEVFLLTAAGERRMPVSNIFVAATCHIAVVVVVVVVGVVVAIVISHIGRVAVAAAGGAAGGTWTLPKLLQALLKGLTPTNSYPLGPHKSEIEIKIRGSHRLERKAHGLGLSSTIRGREAKGKGESPRNVDTRDRYRLISRPIGHEQDALPTPD